MVKGGVHGEGGMRGEGGVHGKGGVPGKGGSCVVKGVHGMHAPPLRDTAGQCAGGTHPTGMHSCSFFVRCKLPFLFCLISTNISIL